MTTIDSQRRPLLLFQSAPYEGSLGRSALDVALSFAVFAQQPQLVFCGDAVLSLKAGQNAESIGRKSVRKVIESLPLYDVDTVFVDQRSLEATGFSEQDLPAFAIALTPGELRNLLNEASHVISL
ncbi:DsrE family protein [Congregibacter sp.]|uniref:DsrE family protein n=1 Tax=Congregibacter sp. TaxID=2744308 RepID=UPI003F6C9A06